MHVGRVGGTLDVRVVAHAPAEVVHGQHRPLVHALGAQVLVICSERGGGCRQGSLPPKKGGGLGHNQAGICSPQLDPDTAGRSPLPCHTPRLLSIPMFLSQSHQPHKKSPAGTPEAQPLPAEMELKPRAKGGVSPSCTETLTLDSEAHRMIGAMIWG